MRFRTLIASTLLTSISSIALAQSPPPPALGDTPPAVAPAPQPDSGPAAPPAEPAAPKSDAAPGAPGPDARHHGNKRYEHKRFGHKGMRRHGPPSASSTGFEIRLGEDIGLRVNCGNEPMAACIEAAAPLIDQLSNMNPSRPDAPPMPPAN